MVKELKQLGEHIIALYGHVTGVKRDVDQIRCTAKTYSSRYRKNTWKSR
jgi:hypothetical protein